MPRFELAVPRNTPKGAPIVARLLVGQSEFNHETVIIPKNHAYLAGLQVRAGRAGIVIPTSDSNVPWLRGDNDTIRYNIHIQLDPPQYVIELYGYNEDDTFDHTFYMDLE